MNAAIRDIAVREGVQIVADRVVRAERDKAGRVFAVVAESGRRIQSQWFLDASGSASRLFARLFQLPSVEYGPSKVAMWDYFSVPTMPEGTTLYGLEGGSYMEWVWRIPIRPDTVSVGYVATGETIKKARSSGKGIEEIYRDQLQRFPSLQLLLKERKGSSPRVTSFRCRTLRKLAGPNWIVIGEAASMIDPMTSNGVTAALRQAREAAQLIVKSRGRKRLPWMASIAYTWRVVAMALFFNCTIERLVYEWPVRKKIGPLTAADVYTIPAWLMNLFYSRLAPTGIVCTSLFGGVLTALRCAATAFHWWCRQWAGSSTIPAVFARAPLSRQACTVSAAVQAMRFSSSTECRQVVGCGAGGITTRLQERYTCFTIDLPGLGKSPQEQYGPDYLRTLVERIDALRAAKGILKWHVVGHDAGSVVAVHYAHYFSQHVDCMALLAPALFPELRPYFLIEPLRKPVLGELLAPLIRPLFWKIAMQRALAGQEDAGLAAADFYRPFSGLTGPWKFMHFSPG